MTTTDKREIRKVLKGFEDHVRWNEPLRSYTTLKIGGPADALFFPKNREDLGAVLRRARYSRIPVFVIGGSNLLVKDGGMNGIVIRLNGFQKMAVSGNRIRAEGGVSLSSLARFAARHGLSGAEFALGIPGSVGGAVVMNAGTREGDMAGILSSVGIVGPDGKFESFPRKDLQFGYRWSRLPRGVVVEAEFQFKKRGNREVRRRMEGFIQHRKKTQPLAWPNAGSIFKNPEGGFAARLIEKLGLKGLRVGEAQLSEQHANFIVNRGGATAKDVLGLIRRIGRQVEDQTGVTLELELKVVGRDTA